MRLVLIQPRSGSGADEQRNADEALEWMQRASDAGADLVVFPECYPGPANPMNSYDAIGPVAERAAELGLHVIAGRIEQAEDGQRYYVTLHLIDDEGQTLGVYRRTTPTGPYIYRDIPAWDFDYVEGAEEPAVYDTKLGRIGMLVCSEVYVPELARVLALKGAEIVFMPAGLWKKGQWDTWRTLTRARAIENLAYTATCQNLLGHETSNAGLSMIYELAGTFGVREREGVLVADVDLERLRWLREQEDGPGFPGEKACKTGVLWQWYRPELYGVR